MDTDRGEGQAPVFQCQECGRFADYAKEDCPCRFERIGDEPSTYKVVGRAVFYLDSTGRRRFRLDTFEPPAPEIGIRTL